MERLQGAHQRNLPAQRRPQDILADTGGTDLGTDLDMPNLIPNVATTDATVPDTAMTETIHQHLDRRGLLPAEHYMDAGYSSAELVAAAAGSTR
ncbi:hypothetical protein GCM10010412_099740 [Nonomuraea recticatena]|uniref:Transposase n=2 Tax=Nonomuraea recticatena TaxID=46178 RepID=A0ABN3TEM6_9ACTN